MATPIVIALASVVMAFGALVVSSANLWLSQLRRGRLHLSTPTIFYFGWDKGERNLPKIMFRAALFSTAKRGIIVENLYIKLTGSSGCTVFSFWGYDAGDGMVRGSGIYVGESGFLAYHHFNPPDGLRFSYGIDNYTIEIWARRFDRGADEKLGSYIVSLKDDLQANALRQDAPGLIWDWLPEQRQYVPVMKSGNAMPPARSPKRLS